MNIFLFLALIVIIQGKEDKEVFEDGGQNHGFSIEFEEYSDWDLGIIFSGFINTEFNAQIMFMVIKDKFDFSGCYVKLESEAISVSEHDLDLVDSENIKWSSIYQFNGSTRQVIKKMLKGYNKTYFTDVYNRKGFDYKQRLQMIEKDGFLKKEEINLLKSVYKRLHTYQEFQEVFHFVLIERRIHTEERGQSVDWPLRSDRVCKFGTTLNGQDYSISFEDVHNLPSCMGYQAFRKVIVANLNKAGYPVVACKENGTYFKNNDSLNIGKFKFIKGLSDQETQEKIMTDECVLFYLTETIIPCDSGIGKRHIMYSGCSIELEQVLSSDMHQLRISVPNSGRIIISSNQLYKSEMCHGECVIPIMKSKEVLVTCPNGYQHKLQIDDELMSDCRFKDWHYFWWIATFLCRGSQKPEYFLILIIWIIFGRIIMKLLSLIILYITYKLNKAIYTVRKKYNSDIKECKHCHTEIHNKDDAENHLLCYKGRCPYCLMYKSLDSLKTHSKDCPNLEKKLRDIESLLTERELKETWITRKLKKIVELSLLSNATYVLFILLFFLMTVSPSSATNLATSTDTEENDYKRNHFFSNVMEEEKNSKLLDRFKNVSDYVKIGILSKSYGNFFEEFKEESSMCGYNCWNSLDTCNCPKPELEHSKIESRMENQLFLSLQEKLKNLDNDLQELENTEVKKIIRMNELEKIIQSELGNSSIISKRHEIIELITRLHNMTEEEFNSETQKHSYRFKRHLGNIYKLDSILNHFPSIKHGEKNDREISFKNDKDISLNSRDAKETDGYVGKDVPISVPDVMESKRLVRGQSEKTNTDKNSFSIKKEKPDLFSNNNERNSKNTRQKEIKKEKTVKNEEGKEKETKNKLNNLKDVEKNSRTIIMHQPNTFIMQYTGNSNSMYEEKQLPLLSQVEKSWIEIPDNPITGVIESRNNIQLDWNSYTENRTHIFVKGNAIGKMNLNPNTGLIWEITNKESNQKQQFSLYIYDFTQKYSCTRKFYTTDRKVDMWFRGACTGDCVKNCACERMSCKYKIWDWDRGWNCNPTWCWNANGGCSCCALDIQPSVPKSLFSVEECSFVNYEYIICIQLNHDKINCRVVKDNEQIKINQITVTASKPIGEIDKLSKQIVNYISIDKDKTITLDHYQETFINTDICQDNCKHGDIGDFQTNDIDTAIGSSHSLLNLEVKSSKADYNEKKKKYWYSMNWLGIDFSHTCIPGRWPSCEYYGLRKSVEDKFEFFIRNQEKMEKKFFIHSTKISKDLGGSEIYIRPKINTGMIDFTISAKNIALHKREVKPKISKFVIKKCSGCYSCKSGIQCNLEITLDDPASTTVHIESKETFVHVSGMLFSLHSNQRPNKIKVNLISISNIKQIELCITEVKICNSIDIKLKDPEVKIIDKNNYIQFKVAKDYNNKCTGFDWFKCTWDNTKNFFSNISDWLIHAWMNAKALFIIIVVICLFLCFAYLIYFLYVVFLRRKRIKKVDAKDVVKDGKMEEYSKLRELKGSKAV